MTTTTDGGILFVAEAGVLAVVDATSEPSYHSPEKILPISAHGVRAVELILDPEAQLGSDPDGDEAILYVAGGRLGLWAMRADPRPNEPMPAARIDDALAPGDQSSARWCNDVEVFEHGGSTYLMALFSQRGCSRLRLYEISDARSVLNDHPGQETGNEIWPEVDIPIGANCTFVTPRIEGFGFGLAVDGSTVYVAAGQYGLVRARFLDPTNVGAYELKDGPWFGNQSYYAHMLPLYDDFEYRVGSPPSVARSDAPLFVDVAVEDAGTEKYLWAAVDHLGVLRFRITDPGSWSTTMPIDHQEGVAIADAPYMDEHVQLVQDGTNHKTYAHRIRIVDTDAGQALAVGATYEPLIQSDSLLDEGRVVYHTADSSAGIPPVPGGGPATGGSEQYTILYDLSSLVPQPPASVPPATTQHVAFLRDGGRALHLPRTQPTDELIVFAGNFDMQRQNWATVRARLQWPQGTLVGGLYQRRTDDRPGRFVFDVTHSVTNPMLIYTGTNDAGIRPDGILVTCGSTFRRFYEPDAQGADGRASFGGIVNPFAVWPAPGGRDFVLGTARPPSGPPATWMLVHFEPGSGLCPPTMPAAGEPDRLKRIYIESPVDQIGGTGRGQFSSGIADVGYDEHVGVGNELVFLARQGTPAGIVVEDRTLLEERILDGNTQDQDEVLAGFAFHRELVTHPEYEHVYDNQHLGFIQTHMLEGKVGTHPPRLATIPGPAGSPDAEHWVLIVPCFAVQYLPYLPEQPDPSATVWIDEFDKAMVRVFDVNDHAVITDDDVEPPTYTLIGPRIKSSAYRVEPLTWNERSYVFVADFGGSVHVWDVTTLLDDDPQDPQTGTSPYFFEQWLAPPSITDDVSNNVFGMALDRVEWHDGETERDEVYVYAAVSRYGIEVLRFLPGNPSGQRLVPVRKIETPSGMAGLKIRHEIHSDERTLLVGESLAGLRTFIYEDWTQ